MTARGRRPNVKLRADPDPLQLPAFLQKVCEQPERSLIMLDFDGTISEIVDDPACARPLPGAPELLRCLVESFGLVAIVSGRPISFLLDRLHLTGQVAEKAAGQAAADQAAADQAAGGQAADGAADQAADEAATDQAAASKSMVEAAKGLVLVGSHGLEMWTYASGTQVSDVDGRQVSGDWVEILGALEATARAELGNAVLVENKRLGLTLHWRMRPDMEAVAVELAQRLASEYGVVPHSGHMCIELRPAMSPSKGDAVRQLLRLPLRSKASSAGRAQTSLDGEVGSAVYVGDDVGDLDAFRALDRSADEAGLYRVKVAVGGPEAPAELLSEADLVVDGPWQVMQLLEALCSAAQHVSTGGHS